MDKTLQAALVMGDELFETIRRNEVNSTSSILLTTSQESDDDEEEILCAAAIAYSREKPKRIDMFIERVVSNYSDIEFQENFRMSPDAFNWLMGKLSPIIEDACDPLHSHMNIPLNKQLLAVMWLLANQESYRSVGERFDMAKSTLSKVFFRVVDALNKLASSVIAWPNAEQMLESSRHFEEKTKIKNIIGVIDGTYIPVRAPNDQKEAYTNRKMFTSVTLQAICNHKMEFIDCFAGFPSSAHDRRVFRNSAIYEDITRNQSSFFPNGEVILGDKAYPQLTWCLVPFTDRGNLTDLEKHFNTVHATARQVIERSFALLFGRFRRLRYLEMNRFDMVPYAIMAACVLHNVCLRFPDPYVNHYLSEGLPEILQNDLQYSGDRETTNQREREAYEKRTLIARDIWARRRHRNE